VKEEEGREGGRDGGREECTGAGDEKALMPLQGGEGKREVKVREGEEEKEGF
jgi:hypothetical protein